MLLKRQQNTPETPYNVLSLDSEDHDGETYIWAVWGHYNGKTINRTFTARRDVVNFLFKRRWPHTILTGVNLDYDLNTLKYRGGFNWDCIYNMGKLITAGPNDKDREKYKLGRSAIQIIELGNWILNTSLKGMCEDFKIEGHIDKHVLHRDGDESELIEACISHTRTGAKVFEYLQDQIHNAGGRIKLTSSSSALDCFLLNHLKTEHQIYDFKGAYPSRLGLDRDESDPVIIEVARLEFLTHLKEISGLTYVGGRCEAFNMGLYNNISCIDLNSSYPFQMRHRRAYPDMNTYRRLTPTVKNLILFLADYEGAAHIKVKAPDMRIPFLHYKGHDKLLFPSGVFSGWYTFPELRTALEAGYKILDCYEAAVFERIEGMFDSYIDTMYAMKEDPKTKKAGKLYMNGLSGKFGQRTPDDSGFIVAAELPDGASIDDKNYFLFGDMVYKYQPRDPSAVVEYKNTAYPLISAYVTAYGRVQLWEGMRDIGFEHIRYCDTDSIHADTAAIQRAIQAGLIVCDKNKLGAWSFDYRQGVLDVRGLKYYRSRSYHMHKGGDGWQYTIKGVPASMHARYWRNRGEWVNRVIKIKTAIRGGKQVNKFVKIYRRDRLSNPKRHYIARDSEPQILFE